MRRIAATVLTAATLVGAGATAAQAAPAAANSVDTLTAATHATSTPRSCWVAFDWKPASNAGISRYDYKLSSTKGGLANSQARSTLTPAAGIGVAKGHSIWISVTPVLDNGTNGGSKELGIAKVGC